MIEKQAPQWGLRQYRGSMWEIINSLCLCLVGLDFAMMFHPITVKLVKEIIAQFFQAVPKEFEAKGYTDWVNTNLKR